MSEKAKLEDFKIKRDENDKPKPKYIETSMGEVGIKPPSIRDLESMQEVADQDDDEASIDTVIDKIQELIIDPNFAEVDKEDLKINFDFTKLRDTFNDIMTHIQGGEANLPGADSKN